MSQEENPRQTVATSVPITPWSAESEADQLMDDLFSDIDQVLEGGSQVASESANPEYVSLQSIVIPEIKVPTVLQEEEEELPEVQAVEETPKLPPDTSEAQTVASPPQSSGLSLFLLGALCVSLASIVTWLISQDKLQFPWLLNPNTQLPISEYQASSSDIQFMEYISRSLDIIDRKTEAQEEQAEIEASSSPPSDTPEVVTNPEVAVNPGTTVLERIYIPIYPSNQVPYAGVPTYTSPSPPSDIPTPLPPTQVLEPPSPPAEQSEPSPPEVQQSEPPSPPAEQSEPSPSAVPQGETPTPVTPEQNPSPTPAIPVPEASPAPTPVGTHTLMGLLEDGDRSVAIFEINGVTQRIGIGEAIGSSGWMLVSVADQKAVIRRNGEVRSIYAGQKF